MHKFQFDAPKYYNLIRRKKKSSNIDININNPNDLWFLTEHQELTPIKNKSKQEIFQRLEVEEGKSRIENEMIAKKDKIKQVKRKPTKNRNILKRDHLSHDEVGQLPIKMPKQKKKQSFIEEKIKALSKKPLRKKQQSLQRTKSENLSNRKNAIKKIRMPCPFPIKIQKQWENQSNRSWYSLSQQSAKKASKSMEQKVKRKTKKSDQKKIKPFRF